MSDGASTYTVVETLRFESRVLKPYADFVAASDLVVGEVYFVVHFVDDRMLVPELKPLVFVGRMWSLATSTSCTSRMQLRISLG